ncbi:MULTISPECIES: histidinol-phosphate transaminase [unclassified Streptomyces]|uniref:pyridoxal phosphate-dependent aminotransferase n=1 Tax=unclassified Streptomyces TaxID=2593676 RepID=UPI0022517D43|nr:MULTISPECIES: histidinol-phosphate transaminase [unclassified Streptomyces]MCX4991152.1 histidinol-phosphate aminotransferase family protein [Streptomyces sp. NBC_00568]MCX5003611.1 histidinol-phosphate aminotransferase family protein [Streptomyces sp. NBC_00638]
MAGNVTSLFRGTAAHSPSMAALTREGDGAGPVDFCIPCNPYFPTPAMFDELAGRLREIITYYPSSADTITSELCSLLQLPPQCVAMGNGSTELITWIDHLLVRESLAIPVPTFGRWTDQPMETGKRVDMFPLQESTGFALDLAAYAKFIRARGTKVAVICNPNNPDGGFLPRQSLIQFMDAMADLDLVIIDESFLEFADAESEPSVVEDAVMRPNVIVLRSLGKNFGLHGIRFGYMVANPSLAGKVRSMLPKWNLNSFAETVVFMLKNHGKEYMESLHMVRRDRLDMARQLSALPGLTIYPSQGNFLFVRLPVGAEGTVVRDRLLTEHRILVRECGNKVGSSSRFLRLVVRPQTDVRRLVSGLEQVLYGSRRGTAVPELSQGTGYSSGTAAVDRLVGATNGAGMQGLAAQANAWPGQPAQVQAPPAPQPLPSGQPAANYPAQQPVAAASYSAPQQPAAAPGYPAPPQPTAWPAAAQGPGAMPAQMPPAAMPAPAQSAGLQPAAQTGMPGMASAASLGAQGGLTAAQVRGRTQPEPPPPQSDGGWGAVGAMLYNQAG